MKALSIKQPWASLIANGFKDIENRTWKTNFRGKIYIHAPNSPSFTGAYRLNLPEGFWMGLSEIERNIVLLSSRRSAIIGEVEIVDCINDSKSIWAMENHWHWVLKNAELYKDPILNVKGKLSFWEFENTIGI